MKNDAAYLQIVSSLYCYHSRYHLIPFCVSMFSSMWCFSHPYIYINVSVCMWLLLCIQNTTVTAICCGFYFSFCTNSPSTFPHSTHNSANAFDLKTVHIRKNFTQETNLMRVIEKESAGERERVRYHMK